MCPGNSREAETVADFMADRLPYVLGAVEERLRENEDRGDLCVLARARVCGVCEWVCQCVVGWLRWLKQLEAQAYGLHSEDV